MATHTNDDGNSHADGAHTHIGWMSKGNKIQWNGSAHRIHFTLFHHFANSTNGILDENFSPAENQCQWLCNGKNVVTSVFSLWQSEWTHTKWIGHILCRAVTNSLAISMNSKEVKLTMNAFHFDNLVESNHARAIVQIKRNYKFVHVCRLRDIPIGIGVTGDCNGIYEFNWVEYYCNWQRDCWVGVAKPKLIKRLFYSYCGAHHTRDCLHRKLNSIEAEENVDWKALAKYQ